MNRLRKTLPLLILCLCLLSACGKEAGDEPTETEWSVYQMADILWNVQKAADVPERHVLSFGDADFDPYLRDSYQLDPAEVEDGAVIYAGGVYAQEIAVLRLTDGADMDAAAKALTDYRDARAGAFAGYAPEQYEIVEKSGTALRGRYIALLIAPDQDAAQKAFAGCSTAPAPEDAPLQPKQAEEEEAPPPVEVPEPVPEPEPEPEPEPAPAPEPAPEPEPEPEPAPEPDVEPEPVPEPEPEPAPEPAPEPEPEPQPEPPKEPWSYSEARIVDAWTSGDRSGLYQEDIEILEILDTIPALSDSSLTPYQKELALHDWMIAWAEYDPGELSSGPIGDPMPNNDNPYGFLTGKKGICTGYSRTFQLLMTLSGIECVLVPGTAHGGSDDHAWNLVKLDGEWYAVDTTWDDPVASFEVPKSLAHRYFNVTSDFLRRNDHFWDESAFPEADGTALAWAG